ncbi:hypothetical protein SI65_02835 [Aspergillus cristatus]|uniref:Sphingoid long-chain base transporter RSB1 n=1 Tax=Aspergillus cristatus TaxID=573508 RepID=A0A1E3BMH4_ASPCR|nr:hypothetical protein SI65_02835 [Aspergillus cristatus]
MGAMSVGCVSALLGYVGRVMMYYNPFNFDAFMLQIILVTTTPIYFCAAIYVTLAFTINEFSPSLARFPPRYIYWVFINCDVVSLVLQAAAGGLSTSTSGKSQIGVDLALAGLAFQVFTICIFCALLGDYLFRYSRSGLLAANPLHGRFLIFFAFLVITILMITIRCAYRLAELHAWYSGGLIRDETLFIWFEGFLILASVYSMMLGHPGLVFQIRKKEGAGPQRPQAAEL